MQQEVMFANSARIIQIVQTANIRCPLSATVTFLICTGYNQVRQLQRLCDVSNMTACLSVLLGDSCRQQAQAACTRPEASWMLPQTP